MSRFRMSEGEINRSKLRAWKAQQYWLAGLLAVFFGCIAALIFGMYLGLASVEVQRIPEPPVPSRAQQCMHLYDVEKSREWAECMGVPYR